MTFSVAEPRSGVRASRDQTPGAPAGTACGVSSFAVRSWQLRRPAALPLLPMTQARVRPEPTFLGSRAVLAGAVALGALVAWALWRHQPPRA